MPQPNNMLPAMMSSPMATGIDPTPMYGMEGMPLPFGSDPRMMLAGQFLLAPRVREMMGSSGYAPFGLGHDQNIYDTYRKQQYTQAQARVVQEAALKDRDSMFRTFRGMSAMAGVGFGADQRRAANSLADIATIGSPMLAAMNPELLDQLGGSRGSAAVMAKRMMDAGRYRLDAATGRMGMGADGIGRMAGQIYDDLYTRGDPRDMGAVTAGQAGALFGELQNRGMVYGTDRSSRDLSRDAVREMGRTDPMALKEAAKRQGLATPGDVNKISAEDLDKLTLDDNVAARLRSFDADRIKRSLKGYAGAVTAMRDIFGDMGRPNAPMQELMGGLEALTMGSLAQMDPARAGQIARQTYNLAKQTGVTMDSAMVLQQHAGARAQQLGLEPVFAVQATQGALAFGGAYRAQGHAAHTAFGAFNADQMTQLDANLRLQAAGSNMANQLGVAMRLREQGAFKKGSDAERFTTAVMSGVNDFVDANGKTRSLNMSQNEFAAMLQKEGVDDGTVRDMLDQRDTNREQIDRYGVAGIVRREQAVGEMRPMVGLRLGETLNQRLRGTGKLSDEQVRTAIDKVAPEAARRVMGMSTEKFSRTGEREAEIAKILEEELAGTDAGGVLAGMSKEERDKFLKVTASQFYGNMDRFVKQSGFRGMGSFQNVQRVMNQDVMREADRQQLQARFTGEMQEAMSPLGRGTAMSRAIDAMQDLRPGDEEGMKKVMAKAFGGVDTKEINMALQKPLAALAQKKKQVEQLQERVGRATDAGEKTRLMADLETQMKELRAQTDDVAKMGEKFGLYKDAGVTKEDTDRALKSTSAVAKSVLDLAGVRGGFGTDVTDAQANEAAGKYTKGQITADEAAVVIMARRRTDPKYRVTDEEAQKAADASGGRLNKDQARAAMEARRLETVGRISDEEIALEMQNGSIDTGTDAGKAAARDLALLRRRKTPIRGSAADVKKLMDQFGLTAEQAQEAADAEQRAKRMGLDEAEDIAPRVKAGASRYDAINSALADREARRFVVTDKDRQTFVDGNEQLKGKLDLGTEEGRTTADNLILKRRAAEEKQRFAAFRRSDDGARFREDVDMRSQDVENVMAKLITSPQMMQRFGMQAIDWHEDLKAGQQGLRDLALLHSGGDMSRLMMGDLDIDTSTREGAEKAAKVRKEVFERVRQQTSLVKAVHTTHGAEGRQLQLGQKVEALMSGTDKHLAPIRDLAMKRALIAEGMDPTGSKGGDVKAVFEELKAKDPEKAQRVMDRFADEANKVEDKDILVKEEREALAANRERVGNEREALGLLGVRVGRGETVQDALARVKKTIADPNADPTLKAGFEHALKNFDRATKSVAAARRIRPEDEEQVGQYTARMKRVEDFAAKHGVSVKELEEKLAKGEIKATDAEKADIKGTLGDLAKQTPAMMMLMKDRGIESPEQLRDYQNMKVQAADRQREALARESGGPMDLLSEFQEAFGFEKLDDAKKHQLAPIATKLGGTEQRRLMQQVIGSQVSMKAQAADAVGVLRDRVKKFGKDSAEGKEAQATLDKMTDPAKKNAGVDVLVGAYRDAMAESDPAKRKAALEKFQTTFGMTGEGLRRFEQTYELQNKLGLTTYGKDREQGEQQLGKMVDQMQTGGLDFRRPADGAAAPGRTHVTGELTIKGNVGYLDAATGGGMAHGGPTG